MRSDWPTIGMQDGNKSTGVISINHQNLITFQINKSKQIETDQNRKNVWSVIPFQLPFSLDFLPHVATLAPMLIQISTVGSTSTWSLQLDLPSVASIGDTPWCHGDFMGILREFWWDSSCKIVQTYGISEVLEWVHEMLLCLYGIHHQKRIKYLKLVGIEYGFILNIMAKYWEYNDGEISQWGCHDGYLYKTWICWWFCDFRGKSTMFEGVEIYWDVVWCHFEQEIWRNCWWQSMASAFHMDTRSWGNDQAMGHGTCFDSQKNIAGGEFSRPCNKVNDGWKCGNQNLIWFQVGEFFYWWWMVEAAAYLDDCVTSGWTITL